MTKTISPKYLKPPASKDLLIYQCRHRLSRGFVWVPNPFIFSRILTHYLIANRNHGEMSQISPPNTLQASLCTGKRTVTCLERPPQCRRESSEAPHATVH